MSEVKAVSLSKKLIKADIQAGLKREVIAEKYGVSRGTITKALKVMGLNKTRAASVPFIIVDDDEAPIATIQQPPIQAPAPEETEA